jgi:hypothetical protein
VDLSFLNFGFSKGGIREVAAGGGTVGADGSGARPTGAKACGVGTPTVPSRRTFAAVAGPQGWFWGRQLNGAGLYGRFRRRLRRGRSPQPGQQREADQDHHHADQQLLTKRQHRAQTSRFRRGIASGDPCTPSKRGTRPPFDVIFVHQWMYGNYISTRFSGTSVAPRRVVRNVQIGEPWPNQRSPLEKRSAYRKRDALPAY